MGSLALPQSENNEDPDFTKYSKIVLHYGE